MSDILLTYIVPLYNTEPYVLKCLQSLVNQGLNPEQYEIIAVDDESTDGTVAVADSFAREHPVVRILCQSHARTAEKDSKCQGPQKRFFHIIA